jgi:hypothetical protein
MPGDVVLRGWRHASEGFGRINVRCGEFACARTSNLKTVSKLEGEEVIPVTKSQVSSMGAFDVDQAPI